MNLRPLRENRIEKVLQDPSGRLARVTFHVYESEGRMRARVVGIVYLEKPLAHAEPLVLAGISNNSAVMETMSEAEFGVSPHFDSNFLYTLGLQPRAPAC